MQANLLLCRNISGNYRRICINLSYDSREVVTEADAGRLRNQRARGREISAVMDHVTVEVGGFVACYKAPRLDRYVIRDLVLHGKLVIALQETKQ